MPASGELAALFAKRGIGDDETDNNIEKEAACCDEAKEEINIPTTTAGLPPRSSKFDMSSSTMQPPTATQTQQEEVDTPSQPINEEGPIKITNLIHNAEVKAVFDERNLEAGIPTPSFLADMRKNLKKPGEKRSSTTPTPQSKVGGYSSDSDAMKKKKDTSDDDIDKKSKSNSTNYNSDSEIKAALSSSSNLLSKSIKKQPTASTSASTCSSDNEVPMDEEKITTTAKHGALAARRSRMVASRTAMSSSASSTTSDPNSKPPPKKSPSQARKERLLARIRASNASTSGNKSVESNDVFDASKTSIISPKSDEFEVCFEDDNIPSQHNPYLTSDTKNESIDSIGNELNESYGSAATLPTNNIQSKVKISMTKSNRSCTPEKSRLQNAATPKIRGNSNFARYEDKEEKVNEGTTTGLITSQSSQPQISPIKQNPSPTKLPSFQEQQQQQQLETDYVASTPRRAINELYPMRQSPSQLSQMSGLTTPSCFPQELTAPLGGHSHLQQPMLIGGPIHEAASFKSDPLDNVVGVGGGSSAFSPGVEAENRRLREQVGTMAQKLEEKDAIISQLMKRIADLEMNNSAARGAAQAQHVNTTFVMDQGRSPSNVSSHVSSSLWDQSQLQDSTTRSQTSGSAFHQPVRKNNSDVRSSVDSTSACLSMPSQSPSIKSTSLQKKSKQRGRSSGGSTPATSSTASVTTTNSSKSGKRTTTRSRSKSSRTGGSQKSKKKDDDERKFVC